MILIREYVFIESAGGRCRRGAQGREDGSRQKGELRGAAEQTRRQKIHQAEVSTLRPSQRDVQRVLASPVLRPSQRGDEAHCSPPQGDPHAYAGCATTGTETHRGAGRGARHATFAHHVLRHLQAQLPLAQGRSSAVRVASPDEAIPHAVLSRLPHPIPLADVLRDAHVFPGSY